MPSLGGLVRWVGHASRFGLKLCAALPALLLVVCLVFVFVDPAGRYMDDLDPSPLLTPPILRRLCWACFAVVSFGLLRHVGAAAYFSWGVPDWKVWGFGEDRRQEARELLHRVFALHCLCLPFLLFPAISFLGLALGGARTFVLSWVLAFQGVGNLFVVALLLAVAVEMIARKVLGRLRWEMRMSGASSFLLSDV
jgi:hypothetical protein